MENDDKGNCIIKFQWGDELQIGDDIYIKLKQGNKKDKRIYVRAPKSLKITRTRDGEKLGAKSKD